MENIKVTTNFANSCFYDENKKIRFDPPVYEQRYWTILRLLELDCWKDSFKKIVEFGCAEMKFFRLLRSLPAVEKILEVFTIFMYDSISVSIANRLSVKDFLGYEDSVH